MSRLTILRLGLGRDSIAMLCLLVEDGLLADGERLHAQDVDAVVFTDTGAEWLATYKLLPRVSYFCRAYGLRLLDQRKPSSEHQREFLRLVEANGGSMKGVPKPWREEDPGSIEARCEMGWYHTRPSIMADYASRGMVVPFTDGGCTENHKVVPMRALLNDLSLEKFGVGNRQWSTAVKRGDRLPHRLLIGIAADEAQRVVTDMGPRYEQSLYPLVEMGITKADETPILQRHGFDDVHKSGCTMCKFAPLSWYWALSVVQPELFKRIADDYEAHALDNGRKKSNGLYLFPKTKGSHGKPMRIREAVAWWRARNPEATIEAVMRKDYKRCDRGGRPISKKR